MNIARQSLIHTKTLSRRAQVYVLGTAGLVVGLATACTVKPGDEDGSNKLDPSSSKKSDEDNKKNDKTESSNPTGGNTSTSTGNTMPGETMSTPGKMGVDNDSGKSSKGGGTGQPTGGNNPGKNEMPHLQFLVVEPSDRLLEMGLAQTTSINFQAFGHYSDGRVENVTDKVEWSLNAPEMGGFAGNVLNISGQSSLYVKTSQVEAKLGGVSGNGQVTVAAYKNTGNRPDFLFILPYKDKAGPKSKLLSFATKVQSLDVFFSVDATGSMNEEREQLQADLSKKIIPQVQSNIADTQFGVGIVQDYPIRPFGLPGLDQPFRLLQSVTSDIAKAQAGVNAIRNGSGFDPAESILEGLYQIATGEGLTGPAPTSVPANKEGIGGVGFRKGTMPVIVSITDASSHAQGEKDIDSCGRGYKDMSYKVPSTGKVITGTIPDEFTHTRKETEDALEKICARVITVASEGGTTGECDPAVDGVKLAKVTKARVSPLVWDQSRPANCAAGKCCTGKDGSGVDPEEDGMCSLVYRVDKNGNGLGDSIVGGIKALAFFAPFDVKSQSKGEKASVTGNPLPGNVKSTVDFIDSITASSFGKLPLPGLPQPKMSGDHFKNVTPGTPVNFNIQAFNDIIRPTSTAQVFRAKIGATADQCVGLELDQREVIFVVPPKPLVEG